MSRGTSAATASRNAGMPWRQSIADRSSTHGGSLLNAPQAKSAGRSTDIGSMIARGSA
jgi:hypothetical protein